MNAFETFIYFFQKPSATPTIFGWYHIVCLIVMIALITLIFIFRHKITQKGVKYTVLTVGLLLLIFEIIKQLVYSFSWNNATQTASWSYQWYAFPFQFCSTPMYLMILAGLCKKGKLQNALYAYLATFALFGGLAVMIYPGDVFSSTLYINFQTMFWHGSMTVIGFLLWATKSVECKQKSTLKASFVFLAVLSLAMLSNYIWKWAGGISTGQTFNMFYISPFYPCTLPLLSIIYTKVPYIVFLLSYILGFILVSYIIVLIAIAIHNTYVYSKRKKQKTAS